jgi:hypothetical protein
VYKDRRGYWSQKLAITEPSILCSAQEASPHGHDELIYLPGEGQKTYDDRPAFPGRALISSIPLPDRQPQAPARATNSPTYHFHVCVHRWHVSAHSDSDLVGREHLREFWIDLAAGITFLLNLFCFPIGIGLFRAMRRHQARFPSPLPNVWRWALLGAVLAIFAVLWIVEWIRHRRMPVAS